MSSGVDRDAVITAYQDVRDDKTDTTWWVGTRGRVDTGPCGRGDGATPQVRIASPVARRRSLGPTVGNVRRRVTTYVRV